MYEPASEEGGVMMQTVVLGSRGRGDRNDNGTRLIISLAAKRKLALTNLFSAPVKGGIVHTHNNNGPN